MTQQVVDPAKMQGIPGPFCCPGCEARGEALDGFPRPTYECPRCGKLWHIAAGEKVMGFPELDDGSAVGTRSAAEARGAAQAGLPYSPDTLDFVYPPVQADDLDFALAVAGELITADDVGGSQAAGAGWFSPPVLDAGERRLPAVEITSYRGFMNALRQRHRQARVRLSVAERTLLLLSIARRGALGDWVQCDAPGGIHLVHPAVLVVMATTPYAELVALSEEELNQALERAADRSSTYERGAR